MLAPEGFLRGFAGKHGKLRAYNLSFLRNQILPAAKAPSTMFTPVGDIVDCVHFHVVIALERAMRP